MISSRRIDVDLVRDYGGAAVETVEANNTLARRHSWYHLPMSEYLLLRVRRSECVESQLTAESRLVSSLTLVQLGRSSISQTVFLLRPVTDDALLA